MPSCETPVDQISGMRDDSGYAFSCPNLSNAKRLVGGHAAFSSANVDTIRLAAERTGSTVAVGG